MANAITSARAPEAPQLEAPVVAPVEAQATGSIARDGLVLSADARPEAEEDQSLWAKGTRAAKATVKVVGDTFSGIMEAISSAFVWNTLMQQYRSMERARERQEEAKAEANASHALTVALARENQAKADNARKR